MAQELEVITKAKKLAIHSIKLTNNINHFPKKYRHSVVDMLNRKCLQIYEALMEANQTNLKRNPLERFDLQEKALTYCTELMFYIELSQELNFISMGSMEHWSKMVATVKYMTLGWMKKDKERV